MYYVQILGIQTSFQSDPEQFRKLKQIVVSNQSGNNNYRFRKLKQLGFQNPIQELILVSKTGTTSSFEPSLGTTSGFEN